MKDILQAGNPTTSRYPAEMSGSWLTDGESGKLSFRRARRFGGSRAGYLKEADALPEGEARHAARDYAKAVPP